MLDSIFNIFGGTLPFGDGFTGGINEAPEQREIGNSEGVEYSEADIERIEAAADIMGEIFTDEVISNWENLTVEERTAYLNEYYARAGQALGIDTKGVYVDDLYALHGYGTQGVNNGDGYLGIDIRLVSDPSQLEELLNTTTHEMRHQLQTDALRNPDAFPDIPQETLEQWQYEMTHYIDPTYDFEGYQNQAIETDARAFAEEVVNEYISDGDNAYSMASLEADLPAAFMDSDGQAPGETSELPSAAASFDPGSAAVEGASEIPDSKPEIGQLDGFEVDKELNKNTFSFTPGQCARISTGTQNYCPFSGSGR